MCECKLILLVGALVMCNVIFVTPFNIDEFNYASYRRENGSMFGFTVAVHKDHGNNGWVLVGAPEAHSIYQSRRVKPYHGGAVYRCRIDGDDPCEEIAFSRESEYNTNIALDNKTVQWFGATLSSSGRIVACAPRYVWYTKDLNRRDPVGTCYVADGNFQNSEEYSPCRTMNWGYHRQGSCQAGFSAAIDRSGDRLFIGAPGSYYWQGQIYSVDAHARFNFTPGIYGNKGYGAKGSVHQQSLATREPVFSTREGRAQDDDSYMGYSTVVGHFLEDQEFEGVAVGMPRGNGLRGKVLLFTWDLHNYKNLTVSRQIGAYFGYSITAADVNGDGRLDIIVGAPMHTEPNNDMKYDVGRVYIFYQTTESDTSFGNFTYIDGVESRSRFGHSVSTLGDLNQDGCEDFAVGAPYAGADGRGAVYIYYGSKDGNLKKSEQVIYAKNIETNIQTFGFSVTGGLDLDGNDYPDMAVGAYLSDAAFFFRAKPVAVVDASVRFRTSHTQKQIDIKKKNCFLPSGLEAICTDVDFCMKYSGKGIPSRLLFNVEYTLDKTPNTTRMGFLNRKTTTFIDTLELQKDRRSCKTERIYIKSDLKDKLTPLVAEMKYSIADDTRHGNPFRDPRSHLIPALDLNSPPSRKDYLIVQKNCGPDNVCIPDLHMTVNPNVDKYLLGSQNDLEIDVVVSNFGEDSFGTTYELKIPKGIFYKKAVTKPGLPVALCSPPGSDNILSCDIGNPLPAGKIASFKIILQPTYQEETPSSYEFDMYVNSTNPEQNSTMANNHNHLSINIFIDASLELRGDSYPPTLYYNESHYTAEEIVKENDIGPQVTHVYYVRNSGPATIQEAEVFILWPLQTLGGEDLLYLLEPPHTQGNVKCDVGLVNYKNYIVGFHGPSIFDRLRIDTSSVDKVDKKASINITETGNGVASGLGVVNRNETLEKDFASSGDSSILIERRHNESSGVNSQGSLNVNGEYVHTEARWRTVWVNGVPHTTWENTTVVKDANGKVLKTFYTNNDPAHYFSNFSGSSLEYGSLAGSGKVTFTDQTRTEEEQNRILEQKRLEEAAILRQQQEQLEESRRQGYEKRLQEETLRKSQTDDRIRQEQRTRQEENRRQEELIRQENERRRQEEQTRRQEEWRRQEEARRAQEVEQRRLEIERRRQEEEERRIQQYGYDEVNGESDEYYTEEERRRQEESYQQGGVQESKYHKEYAYQVGGGTREGGREGQHGQTSTSRGSQHRILTGYYDQQGVYHEYPRDVYGQIIYNKTYTAENTGTIPIDLRGSQSGQHLGFTETSIGRGFRVQTLDLGNAASESSVYENQGGAFQGASGSSRSESESGSLYGAGSSSRQDLGSRQAASSGDGYRQDWHVDSTYSHSGQIPPTIVHNSVEKDNVPTDRPSPYARSRGKRETREADPYVEIQRLVKCKATNCNYIRCLVGALEKDKEVVIALRSRLNVREVKNLTSTQPIKISSMIVGRISKLHMRNESGQILKEHEVFTEIPAKEVELVPEVAPLWIYVVSAVAGVVMLLLLIWLLSKCGFFKRNRPASSAPERQPLSRNGYHSGDEAL